MYNGFKTKAAVVRALREEGYTITHLLTKPEAQPKTGKNAEKAGVLTAALHLAPYNLSGFQVCPQASDGCAAACLHTAGNPAYMAGKEKARVLRTHIYFKHRDLFMALLAFEIDALKAKAAKAGLDVGLRLNATSDLPWESRRVNGELLMEVFPEVQFYDYTKITKRALMWAEGRMPLNYHLTFSRNEDNDDDVRRVLSAGGNVAMVFHATTAPSQVSAIRNHFGLDMLPVVVDGDVHDYRPADPKGCVVALKAKGKAKQDQSGFVL